MREFPGPPPRRTFARVTAFDLACPNCGAVDCVRTASGLPWWKGTEHFNRVRSRWRCRACRRVYVVGLALWPARRSGNRPRGGAIPPDTIPNRAQREQLWLAYGFVRTKTRGWNDEVNLVCTCRSVDDDHAPFCPLWEGEPE